MADGTWTRDMDHGTWTRDMDHGTWIRDGDAEGRRVSPSLQTVHKRVRGTPVGDLVSPLDPQISKLHCKY